MKNAYNIITGPAEPVLVSKGIQFKSSVRGATTWLNFAECPMCGHKGYQCGVSETSQGGKFLHGVKCFHPTDSQIGDKTTYRDFLVLIEALTPQEADSIKRGESKIPERSGVWTARLVDRLFSTPIAVQYLHNRGLTNYTIKRFHLGLSSPYTNKEGVTSVNALVAPIIGPNGIAQKQSYYYAIPDVTENPLDKNGWKKGEVATYWGTPQGAKNLIIAEGMKDVWMLVQELHDAGLEKDYTIITSTHGTSIPKEWRDGRFWLPWAEVYSAQDADAPGDGLSRTVATLAGRCVKRLRVPEGKGKDWTDYFKAGGTVKDLVELIGSADTIDAILPASTGDKFISIPHQAGKSRYAYAPVDIKGDFARGFLYYPFTTLLAEDTIIVDPITGDVSKVQTWKRDVQVVRSDRTVHTIVRRPAPRGTPDTQRVYGLSDGTLLAGNIIPADNPSWSFEAIQDYVAGKANIQPLHELAISVRAILMATIWLPYAEDYSLLTLTILATYVVPIFDSVPLLLVVGAKGSGKSGLANVMARLSFNGSVLGAVSAATIARHIDQDRGFVVLDDLESVGSRTKDGSFSDLIQALKVSYSKATSIKAWTDVKTMRVEKINFFGIKLITNTLGVDQILGSRMFRIQTRIAPAEARNSLKPLSHFGSQLNALRDQLHAWAFAHCREVSQTYNIVFPHRSNRSEEIAAPLRVIATMIGISDSSFSEDLESALSRQQTQPINETDPIDVFLEAVKRLVAAGFREVSTTHVVLEMRTLVDVGAGQEYTTSIPAFLRPEWVGQQLRSHDIVGGTSRRTRLFGHNLRVVPFRDGFVNEVETEFEQTGKTFHVLKVDPTSFCAGCEICPYRSLGCTIMESRANKA